ncbi:hypothetical protein [Mycolicibacterium mageritense]|uniref:hypothetical protein n=1 Tax=Mycolicibacterium mageritense TaxID=53462 RepID=UPI0023F2EDEB|nr:hypothetical protein [Mycolicibacterium mageritense]
MEVTHGNSARRLRAHVLVVTTNGLGLGLRDDYEEVLQQALRYQDAASELCIDQEWLANAAFSWSWAEGLKKAGLEAPTSVGVDLRLISEGGEEVVGRYLAKATYDAAKKAGTEIAAGSMTKEGKEGAQKWERVKSHGVVGIDVNLGVVSLIGEFPDCGEIGLREDGRGRVAGLFAARSALLVGEALVRIGQIVIGESEIAEIGRS